MSNLLLISILTPAVFGLVLFLLPKKLPVVLQNTLASLGFGIPALIALKVFLDYTASGEAGFLFVSNIDTGLSNFGISLKMGVNGISAPLFLLAGIVGLAAGITAMVSVAERMKTYLALLLVMQSGLMGIFSTYDIFYIYFFHEIALIPTFIMIAVWGGQHRRAAAMEMTIYLTFGAMLSLAGLIGIYAMNNLGSFDLISLSAHLAENGLKDTLQRSLFGLLVFGLGVLVSLFPFHSWAPRGYSAAPTSVAMLHAGVLKKFGLYALIQVGLPLLGTGAVSWSFTLGILALGNLLIIGWVTMAQKDLKMMISYASVMHMGYIFLGIASLNSIGVSGAVFLMFAHGLSAALLFNLSIYVQNRCRSFYMDEMGGLGKHTPILAGFFMAAMMASVGLPGFANFWGEFSVFLSLWQWQPVFMILAIFGIVISAVYGLRAVSAIFFGKETESLEEVLKENPVKDLSWAERIPVVLLLVSLLVFGFFPRLASDSISKTTQLHILNESHTREEVQTLEAVPANTILEQTDSADSNAGGGHH
ncbi:MAG: NADH-quinone oxidoreductase subunit M [Opitutales bacterium]|nr:NADH-quinone oxidoreductase subunit M [Opitutales bacterium]